MSDIRAAMPFRRTAAFRRLGFSQWAETLAILAIAGALPLAILFALVLRATHGHFTYSLDDPYIHLALARNIWLGHYGINLSEPSAPSSSIAWPFLLAPFASMPAVFEYVPLSLNAACLFAFVQVLSRLFGDVGVSFRLLLIVIIAFSVNAYGLVFSGMEHSLQLWLVALILSPYLRGSEARRSFAVLPWPVFAALIALPLVRYEGLALSVPLLLLVAWRGQFRAAALSLGVIGGCVIGFSLFLYAHGLGFLPSSVLAKSSFGGLRGVMANAWDNLDGRRLLFLVAAWLIVREWRRDRTWALVMLAIGVLHVLFGKSGWFGRYEAWFALFIALVACRHCLELGQRMMPVVVSMPFVCASLAVCTVMTGPASANIFFQQAQTAQIAQALDEPVAVNDLGLVSLRTRRYVLDLAGLGSITALRMRRAGADPVWMSDLMAKQDVHYAFVYDTWFTKRPASWIRVGRMTLTGARITASSDVVSFYASNAASAARLKRVLADYAARDRSGEVKVSID